MKHILILAALLAAVACGQKKAESKALVLYYSQTGTTKAVAEALQQQLGADIEEIVAVNSYGEDFGATIARGQKELQEGTLPEIQPIQADIASYDVIFLGYPVWFGTYANPIATVLDQLNLTGKKIVPFCTFGSGGLEESVAAIRQKLPEAEVLPGYGVRAARIDAAPAEIERFLKEGGFIPGEVAQLEAFSEFQPATEEDAAIFDAAVGTYPMIQAVADQVASRAVPGGKEYQFIAKDKPREGAPAFGGEPRTMKVHVLVEDGKDPVFTRVDR